MSEHVPAQPTPNLDPNQGASFEPAQNAEGLPVSVNPAPEALPPAAEATPKLQMKYLYGEDKSAVMVPKDAAQQVEWINSSYNTFSLDRRQLHALSPEARSAYLSAQSHRMRPTELAVATEQADADARAKDARQKATEIHNALNPEGDKPEPTESKTFQARLNGEDGPEEPLNKRLNEKQREILDNLAEDVALHGDIDTFIEFADRYGVTVADRKIMLDIGRTTAATRQRAPQSAPSATRQEPTSSVPANELGGRSTPVTSPADTSTTEQVPHPQPTQPEPSKQPDQEFTTNNGELGDPVDMLFTLLESKDNNRAQGNYRQEQADQKQFNEILDSLSPEQRADFMSRLLADTSTGPIPPQQEPPQREQDATRRGVDGLLADFELDPNGMSDKDKHILVGNLMNQLNQAYAAGDRDAYDRIYLLVNGVVDSMSSAEQQRVRQRYNPENATQESSTDESLDTERQRLEEFGSLSKQGRYRELNLISERAHKLQDDNASPEEIEAVWQEFELLYDSMSRKEQREFRNVATDYEFDMAGIERWVKHPFKSSKEKVQGFFAKNVEGNSDLKSTQKQRLELGIDANGDWIGRPSRNRNEDEIATEMRVIDATKLRTGADNLSRWRNPIQKARLNAEARRQEGALRDELLNRGPLLAQRFPEHIIRNGRLARFSRLITTGSPEWGVNPIPLSQRQREALGVSTVLGRAHRALAPEWRQYLSPQTAYRIDRAARNLHALQDELDISEFRGPQYSFPTAWTWRRKDKNFIGMGPITNLEQIIGDAEREAKTNFDRATGRSRPAPGPGGTHRPPNRR